MRIKDLPPFIQKLLLDKEILVCPITHTLFVEPVFVDGRTFERQAIESWFQSNNTNPITGEIVPLEERSNMKTNYDVKSAVDSWKKKVTTKCLKFFEHYYQEIGTKDPSTVQKVLLPILEKLQERAYELSPRHDNVLKNGVLLYNYFVKFESCHKSLNQDEKESQLIDDTTNYLEKRDFYIARLSKHHSLIRNKSKELSSDEEEEGEVVLMFPPHEQPQNNDDNPLIVELSEKVLKLESVVRNQEKEIETLRIQNFGQMATNRELFDRIRGLEDQTSQNNKTRVRIKRIPKSVPQPTWSFDDMPIPTNNQKPVSPLSKRVFVVSNGKEGLSSSDEDEDEDGLVKCGCCERKFVKKAFSRHAKVCVKKKRKVFQISERRVGREAYRLYQRKMEEKNFDQMYQQENMNKKKRRTRQRRIRNFVVGPSQISSEGKKKKSWRERHKEFQDMLKDAKKGNKLNYGNLGGGMVRVECDCCGRKFSQEAIKRHAPICRRISKK